MINLKDGQRFYSISSYLKKEFGSKVIKLSIDGGFTCPNRDGSKGYGGCIFCSEKGSGELASDIPNQIKLMSEKWPSAKKYLAYFQSHTNTYAPISELKEKYYRALDNPGIVGIVIATRPDCINDDVLSLLSKLNKETFLWVELGLQTIHKDNINRCYELSEYDNTIKKLLSANIKVVTHLILGLPGESKHDMMDSVKYVCKDNIFGLKLHLMNVIKGSKMEKLYPNYTSFDSPEEYIDLVVDLLEVIPPNITIHRLTGDVPRKLLISPEWSYKKRTILNGIAHELKNRNSYQGFALK